MHDFIFSSRRDTFSARRCQNRILIVSQDKDAMPSLRAVVFGVGYGEFLLPAEESRFAPSIFGDYENCP
jgi:hypothetical protein